MPGGKNTKCWDGSCKNPNKKVSGKGYQQGSIVTGSSKSNGLTHEPHQDYNGSHSNTRFLWDGKAEK